MDLSSAIANKDNCITLMSICSVASTSSKEVHSVLAEQELLFGLHVPEDDTNFCQ